jgi:hypothetical protein
MSSYDTPEIKLFSQNIDAKLTKAVKAMQRAIKIMQSCPLCSSELNNEE